MNRPRIDWPSLLRTAVRIGLAPREMWRTSLVEWRALTTEASDHGPDPEVIAALRAAFPDKTEEEGADGA